MGRRSATAPSTSTSTSLSPPSITPSTSSSFHSSASSPSSSLPSHLISNELWKYFQIYQILDPIWCFLTKNKTACTITNLQRMIRSHSQEVDLFAMLQRLKIICDPFLLLTPPPDALDSPLDHQHYLLSYSKFHGITPKQKQKRTEMIFNYLLDYCKSYHEIFLKEKHPALIKKKWNYDGGYHPEFDPNLMIPLPDIPETIEDETLQSDISDPPSEKQIPQFFDHLPNVLQELQLSPMYTSQICHIERIPPRSARCLPLTELELPSAIYQTVSQDLKIQHLYSHQNFAIRALRYQSHDSRHVIVSTSTASGKSLLYLLPVLEAIYLNSSLTAIVVFPTKALAQDQYAKIQKYCSLIETRHASNSSTSSTSIYSVHVLDGDTSYSDRSIIQQSANIILTNPDMIHYYILPNASRFERFLSSLKYVILDECHIYKEEFGSHVGIILKRLVRVHLHLKYHSIDDIIDRDILQFICLSATMRMPMEFIYKLLPLKALRNFILRRKVSSIHHVLDEISPTVLPNFPLDDGYVLSIDEFCNGSPSCEKLYILWNPPLTFKNQNSTNSTIEANFNKSNMETLFPSLLDSMDCLYCKEQINSNPSLLSESDPLGGSFHSPKKQSTNINFDPLSPVSKFLHQTEKDVEDKNFNKLSRKRKNLFISTSSASPSSSTSTSDIHGTFHPSKKKSSSLSDTELMNTPGLLVPETIRRNTLNDLCTIFYFLLEKNIKTLVFCKTRKILEIVLQHIYKRIQHDATSLDHDSERSSSSLMGRVIGYRGGYTKEDRRKIEKDMFEGNMLGIVATNALELGIDIGTLECTLHLGVPETYTSLLQQVGRCGRSQASSSSSSESSSSSKLSNDSPTAISIIVCSDNPIDQYYCRHPHLLFQYKSSDSCNLNYSNFYLLYPHILCAIKEIGIDPSLCPTCIASSSLNVLTSSLPIQRQIWNLFEIDLWGLDELQESLQYLWKEHSISLSKSRLILCHPSITKPYKGIHLRSVETKVFQIFHRTRNRNSPDCQLLETLEYSRAFFELYQGAIYLHQGVKYLIVELNIPSLTAYCELTLVDYHTSAKNMVLVSRIRQIHGNELISFNLLRIYSTITGFVKIWSYPRRYEWGGDCHIPPVEYGTCGLIVNIPATLQAYIMDLKRSLPGSLHIANHAILVAIQLFINSDVSSNMETEHWADDSTSHKYRILFYDRKPGGLGACEAVYNDILSSKEKIFQSAKEILLECPCLNGCPSCVLDQKCLPTNGTFDKIGGIILLHEMIRCFKCHCGIVPSPPATISSQSLQHTTFHDIALAASKGVRERSVIFHQEDSD